jgi:DNA-binding MarR family transcriptional regulator
MNDNPFFKPTPLYKEFMILDLIEKNPSLTQREIGDAIGVAVSMVNAYLDEYEEKGFIIRKKYSTKTVEYYVTKEGVERRKLLNIWYLKATQSVFSSAKENIVRFLAKVADQGVRRILLYPAGEVTEIIMQAIDQEENLPVEVVAILDDDANQWGHNLFEKEIIDPLSIDSVQHDGILVSSYKHHEAILRHLLHMGYPNENIIQFFEQ